jgi:hypothetical protein
MGELRVQLQQRLAIDERYVPVGSVWRLEAGDPSLLNEIRPQLGMLADGGPVTKWFDKHSAEDGLTADTNVSTPLDLVVSIIKAIRRRSKHVAHVQDDVDRFIANVAVGVQELTGFALPTRGRDNAIYCRQFATSVSRVYGELIARMQRFTRTMVIFVMGVPRCGGPPSFHAWNWLVEFDSGQIWAFDPQNVDGGTQYANASALLYTFAELKEQRVAVPGLRRFIRRHESVHGGMTLFQLARHPIDRDSRREIVRRLETSNFKRLVPDWQGEIEKCGHYWGDGRASVEDLVRFSDG